MPSRLGVALGGLEAAELTATDGRDAARCWKVAPPISRRLDHFDLHGTHDLRSTFATWLEDGGIPAQAIHELMAAPAVGASSTGAGSGLPRGQGSCSPAWRRDGGPPGGRSQVAVSTRDPVALAPPRFAPATG
jgi:hypothetical protein